MTELRIVSGEEPEMKTKLYTVHAAATHDQMVEYGAWLAMKTGRMAVVEEVPDGYAVVAPRNTVWTPGRWLAAVGALSVSPFVFRGLLIGGVELTSLQGFGIGWITAVIVLLLGRNATRPQ